MKIVRKLLTPDEISNPNVRWDPDTNQVETTYDGGATWTPAPASDPRYSPTWQAPPIVSDNPECDASARMTASLQGVLNTFLIDIALTTAATNVLTYLLLLGGPIGWLFDLIIVVSDTLITIGASAIATAFTTDVWDGIQEIIFCAMSPDGTLTQAASEDVLAQIDVQYPGTVANVMHELISLYGNVLLNNAAYERTETGECGGFTACDETCHLYDPMVVDVDYTNTVEPINELTGTYDTGVFEDDKSLVLTNVHFEWSALVGTGVITDGGCTLTVYSLDVYPAGHVFSVTDLGSTPAVDIDTTGSGHVYRIVATIHNVWSGGGAYSIWDVLEFTYDPVHTPFGWSHGTNCTP